MRDHKQRLGATLALLLLAAPSFAQKVNVDWDRDYVGPWETYAWVEAKDGAQNPLMDQRIVKAVDYWLTMRGRQEVQQNENPDVLVTYHTNTQDEVVVTADTMGYGYGPGFYWGGGMTTTTARSHTYTKGTLVVDVWEPKEKKLLFRGTATDTVDANPEKLEKKINKMVEKMVKEFDKKLEKEAKKKKST
ncbi:MAG TPA: DUF4136 domain-containing protein [Vicinamibacteria bacterium]|nr:DUF4136 domain-containing protein [Vicinamibacteria bacterium]